MKIAMATEYFWPHDLGGSEWSSFYQAQYLMKNGHKVILITPNYGSKNYEIWKGIKIVRFPFLKRIKNNNALSPFWQTNLFWVIISTIFIIKTCRKEKVDILNIQGKYYSPAAYFAKVILKIPTILTVRDYQLICNYSFCIWNKKKACTLKEYFLQDFIKYYRTYIHNKSLFTFSLNLIFAVRGRLIRNIYKYFAKKLDKVVCISHAQAKIYKSNGFKNLIMVYNPMEFQKKNSNLRNKTIIFAGRLTPGKGLELLFEAMPKFFGRYPKFKLLVFGEGFLKSSLKKLVYSKNLQRNILFLGKVNHQKLLNYYSNATASVVPSLWPEPFGRSALESLSQSTPIVVTNKGGLPEIVDNGKTGFVCNADSDDLAKKLIKVVGDNRLLRFNIKNHYGDFKNKFENDNNRRYLDLYRSLR